MNPPFSTRESIRFGWKKTREHSGLLFKVVLLLLALSIGRGITQFFVNDTADSGQALIFGSLDALITIAAIIAGIGGTIITLSIARNQPVVFREIIPSWAVFVRTMAASVAVGILIGVVCLLALSIAGILYVMNSATLSASIVVGIIGVIFAIYIGLRYSMVRFIAIERADRIRDILSRSAKLTKDVKWRLVGFLFVIGLINILGIIVLLVGILVTIPISLIAVAHVYIRLSERLPSPVAQSVVSTK